MENQTMETPMTENKASATPEIEAELTKKQRKIREHRKRIRRAAHYFMHESKNVSTFAKAFNTTAQKNLAWSKTVIWRKVLYENQYTGAIKIPVWKEKIPYSLTEKYLLTKAFISDGDTVCFITYDGFRDVKIKKIHPYSFDLADGSKIGKV